MSGSGGNAFLDLLRVLAPASLPVWVLILLAAIMSVAIAVAMILVTDRFIALIERKLGSTRNASGRRELGSALAFGGTFGALAAYPLAPHVFFVDLDLGLLVILALLSMATLGVVSAGLGSRDPSSPLRAMGEATRGLGSLIPIVLPLLVAVIIGGTANLIEASRLQSDWFGLGWCVFKNPFALPALAIFFFASVAQTSSSSMGDRTRMFLLSAIAGVFFLGGFESPLTWGLRRSLGEDPGFLNHVVMPDGSTQTRIAIGGLVFQFVCAGTLVAKTWLGIAAMIWWRSRTPRLRVASWMIVGRDHSMALGLVCVLGAGVWEWARAALWN